MISASQKMLKVRMLVADGVQFGCIFHVDNLIPHSTAQNSAVEQVKSGLLLSKKSVVLMHNGIDELIWPIELDNSKSVDSFNDTFNLNSDISGVTGISW
tara:strand:- start:1223 stop:1519 length:297 start_codon:yes stop_codon:yes gene_type:complete